jgi:uncharacterized protein (DUF58 family)
MQQAGFLSEFWTLIMRYGSKLLTRFTNIHWSGREDKTLAPLLDDEELLRIHAFANFTQSKPLASLQEVKTLLVGERSSVFSGSGYEFAENRLYVTGDDSRFINWRMLAKTGKLFRKTFIEERRPQLWVVVDKRASMRFGTKKRLKVSQAAIHAIYHIYQAQQQQLATGGVILDEAPCWYNPEKNLKAIQPLIQEIIAPTPPTFEAEEKQNFDIILRQLVTRLSSGSIIVVISDFHQLDNDMLATLHTLTSKHTVIAKHIIDPIEQNLPAQGQFQVTPHGNTKLLTLNCDDTIFRQRYQNKMKQWQEDIEKQLKQTGTNYQLCLSDANIYCRAAL